jgi:hypothetical protein
MLKNMPGKNNSNFKEIEALPSPKVGSRSSYPPESIKLSKGFHGNVHEKSSKPCLTVCRWRRRASNLRGVRECVVNGVHLAVDALPGEDTKCANGMCHGCLRGACLRLIRCWGQQSRLTRYLRVGWQETTKSSSSKSSVLCSLIRHEPQIHKERQCKAYKQWYTKRKPLT